MITLFDKIFFFEFLWAKKPVFFWNNFFRFDDSSQNEPSPQ